MRVLVPQLRTLEGQAQIALEAAGRLALRLGLGEGALVLLEVVTALGCGGNLGLQRRVVEVLARTADVLLGGVGVEKDLGDVAVAAQIAVDGLRRLAATLDEVWQFYLVGIVLGVGVAPLIYLAVPTLINAWCVKRVGFFVGLCMAFTGIGGVIFNPIGTAIIQSSPEGWRQAYLVFGIIILAGTLPFTLFVVRGKPADKGLLPYGAGEKDAADADGAATVGTQGVSAADAMRTPAFWAIVAFCGLITLNQTVYQFLSSYALSFSNSLPQIAAASGVVASAAMGGQAIGKVFLGSVSDHSVRLGAICGIAVGAVGVLLMWGMPSVLALLLVGAFCFGVVYAMTTVETPLLVRSVFGSADYANIYSRVSMVGSLMSAVAAVFWSLVIDSAGGYGLMFALSLVCMAACLALALFALAHAPRAE